MPLIDPPNNAPFYSGPIRTSPFPATSADYPPQAYQPQPAAQQPQSLQPLLEAINTHANRTQQALNLQREVIRRLHNLDEGELITMEKKILDEMTKPAPEITAAEVQDMIGSALEQHSQAIQQFILQVMQPRPEPYKAPHDPMSPAPEEDQPQPEEPAQEPQEEPDGRIAAPQPPKPHPRGIRKPTDTH